MPQCKAKGKTSGKPCTQSAIKGGTVCRMHGGSAPQVREAAKLRLLAMVDPALAALHEIVADKDPVARQQRLGAARDILDRAGLKAKDEVEISGPDGAPVNFVIHGVKPNSTD